MPGPPPKLESQRVRRNRPTFDWVTLPVEGRKGRAPKLPAIREWSPETLRWWKELWRTPQATQWDQTGSTAVPMAVLYQAFMEADADKKAAIAGALLAREDRHGLSPKAMLSLRWRIEEREAQPEPAPQQRRRSRERLHLLDYQPGGGSDAR